MSLFTELKRRNVIRVAIAYIAGAWLLTEVSGTLFPVFGIPDWGVRFVVIVLALGFLPALIISWAYELTPEGLKREKDVVRDTSITHLTAKRLDGITIGLIVVALAFIMADRMWLSPRLAVQPASTTEVVTDNAKASEPEPQYPPNSIAVLPFINMSSDPEQEYFSDGISDELLNLLSKIPEMRVISRSSAFTFKGKDIDIPTIAAQLNVAYILEGSVRKANNQVRITAQLIDARSDTHLWSETYDRELENIFVVQDEISAAVITALRKRLGLQVEAAPRVIEAANVEAHDAYMRGRYLVIQRTAATIEGAVHEYEKAIALEPDYALAHAELAIANLLLSAYGNLPLAESLPRAASHAERAMALDPSLAEAYAATGYLLWWQEKLEEALTHLEQAIQINPNYSIVHTWMRNTLIGLGRYEDAFSASKEALRLDPLSKPAISNYLRDLISRNLLGDADRELEKIATIYPDVYAARQGALKAVGGKWAYETLGDLDALLIDPKSRSYRNFLRFSLAVIGLDQEAFTVSEEIPNSLGLIDYHRLADVFSLLGRPLDAVSEAEKFIARDPTNSYYSIVLGRTLAAAGEYARAKPILEKMWQQYDRRIAWNFSTDEATALIAARLNTGEEARIGELIAAIKDSARRNRETGVTRVADYEEGLAAYLSGEHAWGLALLSRAAESGYFILPNEAYLQTLYDDPDFTPILAGQKARQARERNRFLSIVCTDNPYEAVWQPAEGTCERFAAEQKN